MYSSLFHSLSEQKKIDRQKRRKIKYTCCDVITAKLNDPLCNDDDNEWRENKFEKRQFAEQYTNSINRAL